MNNIKIIIAAVALLVASYSLFAQSHLEKGWQYFNENKYEDAIDGFYDASAANPEAFYGLALSKNAINHAPKVFPVFRSYLANVKDVNPYFFNYFFTDMLYSDHKMRKDQLQYAQELLESGKLNATNRALLYNRFYTHYLKLKKLKQAIEYRNKIGSITDWQIVGHFENVSGSGFDKNYEPIAHPENDYSFTNRNGAPVQWFTLMNYQPGEWFNAGGHSITDNAIIYAQSFVQSTKDQELIIRIGVTGSLKLWINDQLMFSDKEERDAGLDNYNIKVKLSRGYNRILLQLGASDDVSSIDYMVRFTDLNDRVIHLNASAEPKPYNTSYHYKAKVLPHFAVDYFEKRLQKDPNDYASLLLLEKAYRRTDQSYKAKLTIMKARKMAPKATYPAYRLMMVYRREDAETPASQLQEEIKKNDPDNPISLQLRYQEAMDKEDWDEASAIMNKIEMLFGEDEDVFDKRITIYFKKEEQKQAISEIVKAYNRFPNNRTFVYYMYLVNKKVYNNSGAALKVLKKYIKKNYGYNALDMLKDYYGSLGNTSMVLKIYEEMLSLDPAGFSSYKKIAHLYEQLQNYSKAIEYYKKVIAIAPYVGAFHADIAVALKEDDREDEATEEFQKALLYDPNDYDTRKIYREYVGKKDIWDLFEESDLYAEYEKSPGVDDYPDDNSVILHNETQRVVYQGGGSEEKHYLLIKVLNASGIDVWKDYSIYAGGMSVNVEKAEVLKKDGNRLKAEVQGQRVVFTNLDEGDAILLIFKKQNYSYGKLMKHFWDVEYFQHFYPSVKHKYTLMVQGDQSFRWKALHSDMKPLIKKEDNGFTRYVWEKNNTESIKEESYMSNTSEFAPVVHYSSIPDWDFIDQWYYDISTTKAKADYEVKDVLKHILGDKPSMSDKEKAHKIYDYVVKKIRYSSISFRQSGIVPQKASKTINTKIGDCKDVSTLFVALCREAGLKAEIMLVNTRDNGQHEMVLPSIDFNHAIAKVWLDGQPYVVELTSDYLPFATMGKVLRKAFVLDIDGKKGSKPYFLDSPNRVANKYNRRTEVTFDDEGNMLISRTVANYGDWGAYIRASYRDIGEEKRMKEITNSLSDDFAKIKVKKLSFDSTLYHTTDSVYFSYDFVVYDPFLSFENKKLLKLPLSHKQKPLDFLNDDRKYPLDLWNYNNDDMRKEVLRIHTPKGMVLSSVPHSVHYKSAFGEYILRFKKSGKDLMVTRVMIYGKDVVQVDEFEEFSNFYKKIIKADETQIGYRKL